jgi:hypothetical protein
MAATTNSPECNCIISVAAVRRRRQQCVHLLRYDQTEENKADFWATLIHVVTRSET